jgi:hypothetical protein
MLNFGQALEELKDGRKLQRAGWNGLRQYIERNEVAPGITAITVPYLTIRTVQGNYIPWSPSQTDILAEDWRVIA